MEENRESLFQTMDNPEEYDLPDITLKKEHILNIKTLKGKKTLNLIKVLKDYNVGIEDTIFIDLIAVNQESFQIDIKFKVNDKKTTIILLMTQDLEDMLIFEDNDEAYVHHYQNGDLDAYQDLFTPIDDDGRFLQIAQGIIIDTVTQDEVAIDEIDVYFKGLVHIEGRKDPLEEGEQCFQKLGDYVAGSDDCFRSFDLNYKEMAKTLDLAYFVDSASPAYPLYRSEELIILTLQFRAPITGSAGNINVFVDFREDPENPTIYLVDPLTIF